MEGKILIVEDEFIIASDLRMIFEDAGYEIAGIAASVDKALEIIKLKRPAWVFLDIYLTGHLTGIDLAKELVKMNIPFIYVSANSNQSILEAAKQTKPYGFLVKPFREKDVLVAFDIAKYRHEHDIESKIASENKLQEIVMAVLANPDSNERKILKIVNALQLQIPFYYLYINWKEKNGKSLAGYGFLKGEDDNFTAISNASLLAKAGRETKELELQKKFFSPSSNALVFTGAEFTKLCQSNSFDQSTSRIFDVKSLLIKTVKTNGQAEINFSFYSRDKMAYSPNQAILADRLSFLLMKITDTVPGYLAFIKNQTGYVLLKGESEANESSGHDKIQNKIPDDTLSGLIGESPAFKAIKDQLGIIAPFDISVLILGESGTGKEKVAQAIHKLSARKLKPIIKVNCAAIPATLIESELFGHERGAFTGAVERRIGKFEQAAGGTVFLDEIGELTIDLQVKLLCVLQEKEIVRLGGNQIIKTDVRIIAATNINLEKAIAEGRFRLDLYYRLNVFPIVMPPLRERKEDIPELALFFVKTLSRRMGKSPKILSTDVIKNLSAYDWPGNIRELENIIERSLVISEGDTVTNIVLPKSELPLFQPEVVMNKSVPVKTIKEMEKEHIIEVLRQCNSKIAGRGGAAELLDLPPNTLIAKMKKFGIVKDFK